MCSADTDCYFLLAKDGKEKKQKACCIDVKIKSHKKL